MKHTRLTGVILYNTETKVLSYFAPESNIQFLDPLLLVTGKVTFEAPTNLEYWVYNVHYPVGTHIAEFPEYIKNKRSIVTQCSEAGKGNMCMFQALALHYAVKADTKNSNVGDLARATGIQVYNLLIAWQTFCKEKDINGYQTGYDGESADKFPGIQWRHM